MNRVIKMLRLEKRHINTGTPIFLVLPEGKKSTNAGRMMDQELGCLEERRYMGCLGLGRGEMVIGRYKPPFPFQTFFTPPIRIYTVPAPVG
jgi:hypothetical protein